MTAEDFVRQECQGELLTALDLNAKLYAAGVPCDAPAQVLENLYRNGEIELAGTNPGRKPVKVYRIRSRWA